MRWSCAVLVGLLAGLWTAQRPDHPALFPPHGGQAAIVVHLLDNGFHTDLAAPRAALAGGDDPLAWAVRALPPGDWVRIGWGDAVFYVEQGPISSRLQDGARAFFRPGGNPSVVMLDPDPVDPARLSEATRATVRLSPAGFAALRARVASSLRLDAEGRAVVVASRPGDDAVFYASHETFWVGHLCNHWTAEVLNAGGLPMPMVRSLRSSAVMRAARTAEQRAAELDLRGAGD
ncbi:DUF2459 domain-containing protein [Brevundimonas sp. Sa3CVA3]|uniref:DUF2459 domain-containing protein n=1 Tax=Brevundimonas guildfordensis TaxID=2762241 RepID=A0ABR8R2S4_9CAUL|nr:DUF2459 domain-containing protein [Brevundimonas guildfordensis]